MKTKQWAGVPLGNCWCSKKGKGIFNGRWYCNKHLERERYRDERADAVDIQKEAADEFNASHNLFV
jgi:hypothetical protein